VCVCVKALALLALN